MMSNWSSGARRGRGCCPRERPEDPIEHREAMGRAAEVVAPSSSIRIDGGCPVAQVNDLSRSLTAFDLISTLVVVVEMSKSYGAGGGGRGTFIVHTNRWRLPRGPSQ